MNKQNEPNAPEQIQDRIRHLQALLTPARLDRLKSVLNRRTRRLVVVLENLMDPHNASACIRSCEACGLQEVRTIEELSPFDISFKPSIGVARGSERWVHLIREQSQSTDRPGEPTRRCLGSLAGEGYRVVALTPHPEHAKSRPFEELPLDRPLALLLGTEKKGLSRMALSLAEIHTSLPIEGFVESYNVSVACAIAVFNLSARLRRELREEEWQLPEKLRESILLEWIRLSINRIEDLEGAYPR